jgi:N-acetylglucosaminyldiphosphoundecaprenol N-acetyl-beta-D-mannosaminyltransferase
LQIAAQQKIPVFLACTQNGLSNFEEIKTAILEKYPTLEITGANLDKNDTEYEILNTKYKILICNFGAPYQEKFIASLVGVRPRLAIGVGGSFDFLTGKIRRAPRIMQTIGLEWLWRFFQEPRYRFKRIFNAVIIFPIKLILAK